MNKPVTVIYEDFKRELADLVNNSNLPPFIIVEILQNYLGQIISIANRQYQNDKIQYEEFIKENKVNENE